MGELYAVPPLTTPYILIIVQSVLRFPQGNSRSQE